jgi:RNA polymerase sigma factor (sigma-70 family)
VNTRPHHKSQPTDNEPNAADDLTLQGIVRRGDRSAFATLHRRHVGAAYSQARQLTRCAAEADDLVAEAFLRLLDQIVHRGQITAFRAYLLTTVRHLAYDHTRSRKKLSVTPDLTTLPGIPPDVLTVAVADSTMAATERTLVADAFAALPSRYQMVLHHTEIDGHAAAQLAARMGVTANAASACATRAREALRVAYLAQHLDQRVDPRCHATPTRLALNLRGRLGPRAQAHLDDHLGRCPACRGRLRELAAINPRRRIDLHRPS